ncbi:MAG: transcriptional regulator [Akkermansiaceae bacterium]|nr:transcriptional regulator [Akkermansiaceae bacterium]
MRHRRERIELPTGSSFRVIEWARSVDEVQVVMDDGRRVASQGEGTHWHYHPEMELTWFSQGEGLRFIGDHIGPFTAGDLVLVGRRLPHHWQIRGESSGVSVQWHYPEGHPLWAIPELRPLAALFAAAQHGLHFPATTAGRLGARMTGMARLTSGPERFAALLMIFADLAASLGEVQELSCRSFAPPPEDSPHHDAIRDAVGYLLRSFREPVSLEKMLEITRMTRPTFCRQFRLHTGHSFSEFLNRVRLHAACRDLKSGSKPVIDIALDSGISQVSFFNRLFLREMGCTPSQYRRTGAAKAQMDFRQG